MGRAKVARSHHHNIKAQKSLVQKKGGTSARAALVQKTGHRRHRHGAQHAPAKVRVRKRRVKYVEVAASSDEDLTEVDDEDMVSVTSGEVEAYSGGEAPAAAAPQKRKLSRRQKVALLLRKRKGSRAARRDARRAARQAMPLGSQSGAREMARAILRRQPEQKVKRISADGLAMAQELVEGILAQLVQQAVRTRDLRSKRVQLNAADLEYELMRVSERCHANVWAYYLGALPGPDDAEYTPLRPALNHQLAYYTDRDDAGLSAVPEAEAPAAEAEADAEAQA